jgi:autotransporter-associated beta strand protein
LNCESVSDLERASEALNHTDQKTRMRQTDPTCAATLIALILLAASFAPVKAQNASGGGFWNGGTSNLWSGVNWSPDVTGATSSSLLPGADVVFSVTGVQPQHQSTVHDVDETISSLTVNDLAAVTISGPHTLSITGTGITINSGAGLTTINSDLQLSGLPEITVNSTAGLVINGIVGGTIGLTKAGIGQLTLTGANTYTGGTTITTGSLQLGTVVTAGSIIGAVTTNNGTFDIVNANTAGITTITNNNGGVTLFENANTAGNAIITNNGGITQFNALSTAGNATITTNSNGKTSFNNASTAGNAVISNNNASTQFYDTSTAGTAVITNTNSLGETAFFNSSTAGTPPSPTLVAGAYISATRARAAKPDSSITRGESSIFLP